MHPCVVAARSGQGRALRPAQCPSQSAPSFKSGLRLTRRSSGEPTARRLARRPHRCILRPAGQSPCRWLPLNSNVRRPLSEARTTGLQRLFFVFGAQPARRRQQASWVHCAARSSVSRASRCRRRRPRRRCLQGEATADAPVCILASWPPGLGKAARSNCISVPRQSRFRSAAGCA